MPSTSLWGTDFEIPDTTQTIIDKVDNPKEVKKRLNSKTLTLEERLNLISKEVHRILGKYVNDTQVIRSEEELSKYIDKAIEHGYIAIDTETNNTVKIFANCKIMGLCLYIPGLPNTYVPVNHIDRFTKDLLPNQVTEAQIKRQLDRLVEAGTKCIFHNAIFDIEVIEQTCGCRLPVYWDTQSAAHILDENSRIGLKLQYRDHIDPTQEKYDIEGLFKGLKYAVVDPELFALYAATDAYMTYKLYEYQYKIYTKPENADIYGLLTNIEIPVLPVVVDMESRGVCVDLDYATKMSTIYHQKSETIQEEINIELENLRDKINAWRATDDANARRKITPADGSKSYWSKSKAEQLADPIETTSSTQLAILLYDILRVPIVDPKHPRGTDKNILEELAEIKHIKICDLIVKKRKVDILINTFIDALPEHAQYDGRVHCRFKPTGTVTGRFASSDPNLQNIPSHDKLVRMIFKPSCEYHDVEINSDFYEVNDTDDIEIDTDEWKNISEIKIGDKIKNSEDSYDIIKNIVKLDHSYQIYV